MHTLADFSALPAVMQGALSAEPGPLGYRGVSHSQLSIARHFGVIKVGSQLFTYFPGTDELIRDDVLKAIVQHKKQIAALEELSAIDQQLGLWA